MSLTETARQHRFLDGHVVDVEPHTVCSGCSEPINSGLGVLLEDGSHIHSMDCVDDTLAVVGTCRACERPIYEGEAHETIDGRDYHSAGDCAEQARG